MAVFTIFPSTGTTIYMDPVNGSNGNSGLPNAPVRNFGAAWALLPTAGGNIVTAAGRVSEALNYTSKPVNWYADGYVEVDGDAGISNYAGMVQAGFTSVNGFHFKNYGLNNRLIANPFAKKLSNCTFSHVNFTAANYYVERCLFQDCGFSYITNSNVGAFSYCTFIKCSGVVAGLWSSGSVVSNNIFLNCPNLKFGTQTNNTFLDSDGAGSIFDYNIFATTTADVAGTELVLQGKTLAQLQSEAVALKNLNSQKYIYTDVFDGVLSLNPNITDAWKNSYTLKPNSPVLFKSSDRIHPGARNVGYRFDAETIANNPDYLTNLTLTQDSTSKYFVLTDPATEGIAVFSSRFGSVKTFDVSRFCVDLVWDDLNANGQYDEVLDFITGTGVKSSFDFYIEYGNAPLPNWDQNVGDQTANLASFISRAKLVEWQKPIKVDNTGKGNADSAFKISSQLVAEADYFRIGFKIKKQ
jgi:hypothetical protein